MYILAVLLGLLFGSFAGASVWRLRARQLVADKKAGEHVNNAEYRRLHPLTKSTIKNDRSRCLECGHTLAWYDLLPLLSWVSTRGTCRYCKKKIGYFEPLIEISTAIIFITITHAWLTSDFVMQPYILAIWLSVAVMFVILFVYDAKWFILPDSIVFPLIGLSFVLLGIALASSQEPGVLLASTVGAVLILSGIYFVLWVVSKGQWIGFGDVKLGLALGLLLMDWKLAFLALFLANLIGTLIVIPGLISKKMTRKTQVPFGPLLIAGFAIAALVGPQILSLYQQVTIEALSYVSLML